MDLTVIEDVTLVPGGGRPVLAGARVVLDADGVVQEITSTGVPGQRFLVPAAVDLHLDNMAQRRRPRATVVLDQADVLAVLDAECAAAGIGVVCLAARCEDAPGKGIHIAEAVELARVLEQMAPSFACDWRLHVRVEITDAGAIDALREVLAASSRVAIISMMEHSADRSRFATAEENRAFYAADWGVSPEEVDRLMAATADGAAHREERRAAIAALAHEAGVLLASHDDATPQDVEA
uniref:hypothetical protein n=1 Tax=Actinotalea sp. C106 TaxID=2908644 RepID=UPI002027D8CA